jgi:quercetin dioxygenase-like cupin family protein
MRSLAITAMSISLVAWAPADANPANAAADGERRSEVRVTRSGSQPSTKGPAEYFTGNVRVEGRFQAEAPARIGGATVVFEPGAHTAWHTHPLGQTLIVTAGAGLVQHWGGPVQDIRPGDVVWIPPGVKHWHGAAPTTGMTHIAVSESQDGKSVEWMEKVTDQQYRQ